MYTHFNENTGETTHTYISTATVDSLEKSLIISIRNSFIPAANKLSNMLISLEKKTYYHREG